MTSEHGFHVAIFRTLTSTESCITGCFQYSDLQHTCKQSYVTLLSVHLYYLSYSLCETHAAIQCRGLTWLFIHVNYLRLGACLSQWPFWGLMWVK